MVDNQSTSHEALPSAQQRQLTTLVALSGIALLIAALLFTALFVFTLQHGVIGTAGAPSAAFGMLFIIVASIFLRL